MQKIVNVDIRFPNGFDPVS